MTKLIRVLVVFASLCADVQVRASEAAHTEHGKSKANSCWGVTIPCRIPADKKHNISESAATIVLKKDSLLEQTETDTVSLIKGRMLIELKSSGLKIKTPFAAFSCEGECSAIFDREPGVIRVRGIVGAWRVNRLGDQIEYALNSGTQVLIGKVDASGKAEMEIPQSLPWDEIAQDWAELFPRSKKEFKSELADFRVNWKMAVEWASRMQLEHAKRSIAAHEAELARERAARAAQEREDAELRRLFRQKNYIE